MYLGLAAALAAWYNDSNTLYLFIRLSERRTNVTVE